MRRYTKKLINGPWKEYRRGQFYSSKIAPYGDDMEVHEVYWAGNLVHRYIVHVEDRAITNAYLRVAFGRYIGEHEEGDYWEGYYVDALKPGRLRGARFQT